MSENQGFVPQPLDLPKPSVSASTRVALKFAADSKAAGWSLQPVVQCSFLKSDLSFFPLFDSATQDLLSSEYSECILWFQRDR